MTTKEQAILNLRDFRAAADEGGFEFSLLDGTLLGAYRDGDFCPGDEDDVDIGVLDCRYDLTNGLLPLLAPLGFLREKNLLLRGRVEGFSLARGASHIDVIRINHHPSRPECYNLGRRSDVNALTAFVYPDNHHAGFEEILFHGMRFNIPADPEGLLTARYGDWRTRIDRPAFCWWTQSNRESIRHDYDML